MNYTKHYQLSQWEAGDRVLREDFNADNQKIDAAIKAARERESLELLYHCLTQEDAAEFYVDIPGFDWADWSTVHFEVEALTAEDRTAVTVSVNGEKILDAWGNAPGSATAYLGRAVLFPWHDKRRGLVSFASNGYTGTNLYTYSSKFSDAAPHQFKLSVYRAALLAGSRISVWGQR